MMRVSIQTNHDDENLKMRKDLSSLIPTSSPRIKRQDIKILSREELELWIKNNPDADLNSAAPSLGVSYTTILRHCKKYGISRSKAKYPKKEDLRAYLLSNPDVTYRDIANHFGGSSKGSARGAVIRYGLDSLKKSRHNWSTKKGSSRV